MAMHRSWSCWNRSYRPQVSPTTHGGALRAKEVIATSTWEMHHEDCGTYLLSVATGRRARPQQRQGDGSAHHRRRHDWSRLRERHFQRRAEDEYNPRTAPPAAWTCVAGPPV